MAVTMIAAIIGNTFTSVLIIVSLELLILKEAHEKAFSILMNGVRHDRRVHALANKAA
jgi:hypothetical protein